MKRIALFALTLGMFAGCSTMSQTNTQTKTVGTGTNAVTTVTKQTSRAIIPAYPWQDNRQILNKAHQTATDKTTSQGVQGYENETQTSTNASALVESVVSGAVSGVLKVVKP